LFLRKKLIQQKRLRKKNTPAQNKVTQCHDLFSFNHFLKFIL
jgi:hypothetical protein